MNDEARTAMSAKIRPSIQRVARHAAIESGKRIGQWMEEAIEEKAAREGREKWPK